MASIVNRHDWLHISYYEENKQTIKALKLRNTRQGQRDADKIKMMVENYISLGMPVNLSAIKLNLLAGVPIQVGINTETPASENNLKLSEGFNEYCDYRNINKKKHHIQIFNRVIEIIGDKKIIDVTYKDDNKLKDQLLAEGKQINTVANYIDSLITVFKVFVKNKLIDEIPFERMKHPGGLMTIIPSDERDLILNHCNNEECKLDYYLFKILFHTGFRISEALQLQKQDINFKTKRIHVRNVKVERFEYFPLYNELENFLPEVIDYVPDDLLFKNYDNWISLRSFQKVCTELGLKKYKLHNIRHTFGSIWARKVKAPVLQSLMRHSTIHTTMKYYIDINVDDNTEEMNRINSL